MEHQRASRGHGHAGGPQRQPGPQAPRPHLFRAADEAAGVEVRPLRQMNFHSSFNEVFLTGARIPADNVVGKIGEGWAVALTTLAYERKFGNIRPPAYDPR